VEDLEHSVRYSYKRDKWHEQKEARKTSFRADQMQENEDRLGIMCEYVWVTCG